MPPKKQLPQPIDRPLSRAYLRQFKGWSCAYPPGASDPASMRVMENLIVNRDGSVRVRPGLKKLTDTGITSATKLVSSHEAFYLNNGKKAYLLAVRETVGAETLVTFRVGIQDPITGDIAVVNLIGDTPEVAFDITGWTTLPSFSAGTTYVRFLQIDNKILALSNNGEPLIVFYVGETKKAKQLEKIDYPKWKNLLPGDYSTPSMLMPSYDWYLNQTTYPGAATAYGGPNTLISSTPADNVYNYAAFYTYANELGESEPSQIGQARLQRPFGGWLWETSGVPGVVTASTFPSGTLTAEASQTSDRLALTIPNTDAAGFDDAVAAGATKVNFYVMSWSIQESVPVEAILVGSRDLTATSTLATAGWFVMDPSTLGVGSALPLPTPDNRYNSSGPSCAGQGLVAADRLVLVNDPTAAAVIRWTTNQQGNYLDFSSARGGGFKTLTSGNMQIPACVKLWQNPQSADTLTILNEGTDGYSTAYYMAPASVTSQSDNTIIMGFEETTATPGTVSPYGCEVANNALYHPLDDQLMKSTASNYNINHKAMTDQIVNKWVQLADKKNIVSCFFDQRLYFLVHNPDGAPLETGCMGNEVWVLDLASEGGSWSRWLTQGVSLRKIERKGMVHLSLIRPDGLFIFDESKGMDTVKNDVGAFVEKAIYWQLETNTQGANRAHDAWSHLQQVSITLGSFTGQMRYGIRGKNQHGTVVDINKVYAQDLHELAAGDGLPFDAEDHLRIAHVLKEWSFYASSVVNEVDEEFVVEPSFGQLTLVQYRYTPASVNIGYDYGSVETFEYGGALAAGSAGYTDNGIPQPFLDTGRP